jgi:hypothetical protein
LHVLWSVHMLNALSHAVNIAVSRFSYNAIHRLQALMRWICSVQAVGATATGTSGSTHSKDADTIAMDEFSKQKR